MIDRRLALSGLSGLLLQPLSQGAQAATPRGRIGYLHPNTVTAATYVYMAPVWRSLGFDEGQSVHVRSAGGDLDLISRMLDDLVSSGCDVLILVGPQTLRVARARGITLPIVAIDLESDPVREGYARTIARPSGNITGLFMDFPELANKWLQLLTECVPGMARVAILWDPAAGRSQVDAVAASAERLGLAPLILPTSSPDAAVQAVRGLHVGPATGAMMLGTPARSQSDEPLTRALIDRRLPSVFHLKRYVQAGGLMSYGPRLSTYFPRAVEMAVKIISGANAGEVPIQRPHEFDLAINLRTAGALGLSIPQSVLFRADEVVE